MPKYANRNGNSGVDSYEYGNDWIVVTFTTGSTYRYSYRSAGAENIEQMKILADAGSGLNSFIMKNPRVRKGYE
ncbi:hypothetical protein ABIE64_001681 [Thalassospira sp. MBR-102]|jgi:hypothetical protein|uniref:hypothetical protein n=1 Tax=Thalassospira sp. MBR-102 TaxID=3156466 RepID=UPI0033907D27